MSLAELNIDTDPSAARAQLEDACRLGDRAYARRFARERIVRSMLARSEGDETQAQRLLEEAIALCRADPSVDQEVLAIALAARLHSDRSEGNEALGRAEEARTILTQAKVRRTELVMERLSPVLLAHSAGPEASSFRIEALRLVEDRADRIRDRQLRETYLGSPVVRAIRAVPS